MGCYKSKINYEVSFDKLIKDQDKFNKYNLDDRIFRCKVIDVYDGDTIHIVFDKNLNLNTNEDCKNYYRNISKLKDYNIELYQTKIRLYKIDCPEIRTKNSKEKKDAIEAKNRMEELVLNKILYVHILKSDKYAERYIGKLYYMIDDIKTDDNINQIMIDENYAYEYYGKTKKKYSEQNFKKN